MEEEKSLDPQLWQACAGPTFQIPSVNSMVFYFAQGHAEHANAPPDFHVPGIPPLLLCRVVAVKLLAEAETDEVYTKITLLPVLANDLYLKNDDILDPTPSDSDNIHKPASFGKTLTQADLNFDSEFPLSDFFAETFFPPLDYLGAVTPFQNIIVKDIHGRTWNFQHIYKGTPPRHLLSSGWSFFVHKKKLIVGDSVVFLRFESRDLFVGIRRAKHGGLNSNDVNAAGKVRVESAAEAVSRAVCVVCGQEFEVVYYPRADTSEFFVKAADVRSATRINWSTGMRFKMAFETKDSYGIRWFTGTVSGVQVADPIHWPNSPWRLLQVAWDDESDLLRNVNRISPWLVELVPNTPPIPLSPTKKLPFQKPFEGFPSLARESEKALRPVQDRMRKVKKPRSMPNPFNMVESEKNRSKQQMDEEKNLLWRSDVKKPSISTERSGAIITKVADKPIITALPLTLSHLNDDSSSFHEPLAPSFSLSDFLVEEVTNFMGQFPSDVETLAGHLSASSGLLGIKPQDNPSQSVAVTTYMSAAKEMTQETECILVFTSNDNNDVDETLFIETILKKLQERGVTPLTYNLLGRENKDEKVLYRSNVGIVILSNSAYSSQSLEHLVEIMEHGKATNLVLIPIYFKATLSDIYGLEGRFEAVFMPYLNSAQPGRVQEWKAAMAATVTIDGHTWTKETQVILADEVVINACLKLYLKKSKNLVRILALLNHSQPCEADIVGIWGMAGIGKTAVAREIFGILAPQYDLCYFLEDFYLMCQKKGVKQMRDDFYSKLFGEEKLSIGASDIKPSFMRNWFQKKQILVVLDDISDSRDAETVVGGFGWFSHGHRIILTSRKKQVLVQCKVKEPYEIQKLDEFESFRLCKQYLNGENAVIPELLIYGCGNPLALKVLGSSLSKQDITNLVEHLKKLRRNPPTEIQDAFRRSFDGLDENEKNIFLDLACFFRGENMDHVVQLLDACGFLTYLGICDLVDESLISLSENRIEIPIPFQDIGRCIVQEEDEDPCERSRLWDSNDIVDVLTNNSGTEAIEGIFLDASDLNLELSPIVFCEMYRLRLLKFYCSTSGKDCKLSLPEGLDSLPDELRLLHWENYPLEYLPRKFNSENLVELNMPYSNMEKLWEGKKNLEKLKKIILSHSRNLTDIFMLSEALNLEHIDLEGCTSLVDVSSSIARCGKLVSLNMKDCPRLQRVPSMVGLTSLKLLNLSGCSELEEIHDFAPNLKELYLAGTAIRELPLSIENLTELNTLDLEKCIRLQQLPCGIKISRSIVVLKLSGCTSLDLRSMGAAVSLPTLSPFPTLSTSERKI